MRISDWSSDVCSSDLAGDWDVRRFRPTALIAVDGDDFAEDGWMKVQAGPVGTDVLMPTPRCSMPSRPQPGLDGDKAIGTTLRDEPDNNLGLYAPLPQPGNLPLLTGHTTRREHVGQ